IRSALRPSRPGGGGAEVGSSRLRHGRRAERSRAHRRRCRRPAGDARHRRRAPGLRRAPASRPPLALRTSRRARRAPAPLHRTFHPRAAPRGGPRRLSRQVLQSLWRAAVVGQRALEAEARLRAGGRSGPALRPLSRTGVPCARRGRATSLRPVLDRRRQDAGGAAVLSVLVPAYNEAASIAETVRRIRETMSAAGVVHEIIVIDDGSTDETAVRAETAGVAVIRHPANGGYGRALKSGMRQSRYDWCAIVDADGSYPIERLPDLLEYVPRFDMIVGARQGRPYSGRRGQRSAR